MSDYDEATSPARRYGSLRYQMNGVSKERHQQIRKGWVERVLELLEEENLITGAALDLKSRTDGLTFECNFAEQVWDDPRIAYRVRQLAERDVRVELVKVEQEVAGRMFGRFRIVVRF
jgi:hypothetical protein